MRKVCIITGTRKDDMTDLIIKEIKEHPELKSWITKVRTGNKGKEIGEDILNLISKLNNHRPDFVLILSCNKDEGLSASIASSYMNIPTTNVLNDLSEPYAGGFAIHICFVKSKKDAKRLRRFGIDKWRIYVIKSKGKTIADVLSKVKLNIKLIQRKFAD